ncbi:hypothetical protein AERO8C_200017 [Aeromonas veronii]|uniref:Uncharacterized protein n=1 Tax=Aeromonas veronii TaxID=654 RepID=A0A653L5P6_AERVE|nr:hypothetical protein AERO8C_200017 [Aeromonas veronii]
MIHLLKLQWIYRQTTEMVTCSLVCLLIKVMGLGSYKSHFIKKGLLDAQSCKLWPFYGNHCRK